MKDRNVKFGHANERNVCVIVKTAKYKEKAHDNLSDTPTYIIINAKLKMSDFNPNNTLFGEMNSLQKDLKYKGVNASIAQW